LIRLKVEGNFFEKLLGFFPVVLLLLVRDAAILGQEIAGAHIDRNAIRLFQFQSILDALGAFGQQLFRALARIKVNVILPIVLSSYAQLLASETASMASSP